MIALDQHAALGRALAALVRADVRVTVHAARLCDPGDGAYVSGDTLGEALDRACAAVVVTP